MMPIYEDLPFQIWFIDDIPEELFVPSDYLLFYIIYGTIHVTIAGRSYHFYDGGLFIVHPGEAYGITESDNYVLCAVRMSFGFLLRCCEYNRPSFYTPKYGHQIMVSGGIRYGHTLREKIEFLAREFFSDVRPDISRLTYLFYDFVYFFIENCKTENYSGDLLERRTYQIRDFIETSYHLPISLTSLAKALDLTPQYLSVFIKKKFGITFVEYLNGVRLKHAEYDLIYTRETITQIMYKNGFPNAGRFNDSFKKLYGTTPLEYRHLMWDKNNGSMPEPPDSFFSQRSVKLYHDFLENKFPKTKVGENRCQLNLDSHRSEYLPHPWCTVLNVGNASSVLNIDYYNQLLLMKEHLQFKYARMVHMPLCVEDNNFTRIDAVIDAVKKTGMLPWIVVESDLKYFQSGDAIFFIEKLLDYCSRRYGYTDLKQWKFEFSLSPSHTLKQYADLWLRLFRIVRRSYPGVCIGGPSCPLTMSPASFDFLFVYWKENQCIPDFISLAAWPVIEPGHKLTSSKINQNRLKSLEEKKKNILCKCTGNDIGPEFYIVDTGFVESDQSYINDSVFMGNYWIKTCIEMEKYASVIASPPLSDITCFDKDDTAVYPDRFLRGGRGLMTSTSIFKPIFFGLKYLSQLGERCLHKGNDHVITIQDNSELTILLYNYKHPDNGFCETPFDITDLEDFCNIFTDTQKVEFCIKIKNLQYKKYQVTKFILNENYGSILDSWFSFGQIAEINRNTLNYLRATLWPKVLMYEVENKDGLYIREVLNPHEIIMMSVIPVQ